MFQGATGYIELFEGKMFCYPDGGIRFIHRNDNGTIQSGYTDLTILQGDLVSYEGVPLPDRNIDTPESWSTHHVNLGRYEVSTSFPYLHHEGGRIWVLDDCELTITHPECGETKYEALQGEMLALLPGTSRPCQKNEGGD